MPQPVSVSGSNVVLSREAMRSYVGDDAFARGLGAVTPRDREAYLAATPESWVPVDSLDRIVVAIGRVASIAPEQLIVEITRRSQERWFHRLTRLLLRVLPDHALIEKAQRYYDETYDTGRISSVLPGGGRAIVTLDGWEGISGVQQAALGARLETTLRCGGRKDARAVAAPTADGAVYTCTWTP